MTSSSRTCFHTVVPNPQIDCTFLSIIPICGNFAKLDRIEVYLIIIWSRTEPWTVNVKLQSNPDGLWLLIWIYLGVYVAVMRYLSESVGEGFHHDAVVIIALLHKFLAELFGTKHTDCKQPDIVLHSAFQRSNKIRQTEVRVRTCGVFLCLLKMRKKTNTPRSNIPVKQCQWFNCTALSKSIWFLLVLCIYSY